MTDIQKRLFELQDIKYREFHAPLVPNIDSDRIIGVRVPLIRSLAGELFSREFISALPHYYYDENMLHAFMISALDYEECIFELDRFLPYVDNWGVCDSLRPKCFKKNTDRLIFDIGRWLSSSHPYAVRFGIEMLMVWYLEDNFKIEYAERVAELRSEDYYVNMMRAWYFATALAKQYDAVLPLLATLDEWTLHKTVQKACESYRITGEQKIFLKGLR
ncbi:MAG: DNA alkylation repair protein [Clostridia bacterium]|nr:DNA alkylation repair protein [Clostridia bacterium]